MFAVLIQRSYMLEWRPAPSLPHQGGMSPLPLSPRSHVTFITRSGILGVASAVVQVIVYISTQIWRHFVLDSRFRAIREWASLILEAMQHGGLSQWVPAWLFHLLAVCPKGQVNRSLDFFICKVGMIIVPTSLSLCEDLSLSGWCITNCSIITGYC